jgi:Spx/MgsR family transcriptional regulator
MPVVEAYLYSNCSSCKNADAYLRDEGIETTRRDLFKERLSVLEIRALFARVNLAPSEVLSKRSRPYAELGLAEKQLSDDEIIELMAQYPALIRRPIIVKDGQAVLGFNRSAIAALVKDRG